MDRTDIPPRLRHVRTRNAIFQVLQALKENRHKRSELGELFVEGIEPIKQALAARWRVRKVVFADYRALSGWARSTIASVESDELLQVEAGLYRELTEKEEPAELLMTFADERPTLAQVRLAPKPLILVFDRPSDHGNLGTLIRSANAFGVDAVVTTGHGVDVRDPKVIRASLGALFHTPVIQVESAAVLESWLGGLRASHGLSVVGTDSTGSTPADAPLLRRPCALILGNEARGMSAALRRISEAVVRIPMQGQVNSLNVACAGSILLWQIQTGSDRPTS